MLKSLFTLPFAYHQGELLEQAFTQTAPKAKMSLSSITRWVISKLVIGGWGSADVGCPFEEEVIQHMMAAVVDTFAGDGAFPQLGCEYSPAGNSLAVGPDPARLLGQYKAVTHPRTSTTRKMCTVASLAVSDLVPPRCLSAGRRRFS